jgi:hypothetical protein
VIRNETLLLLISLTRGSEDLRKIVAFEGAFERCFNIVREEGASDGGIIVQDCLELCNNLLRGSPSNQSFFRESSFLHQMPAMVSLKVHAPSKGAPPLPAQKAANLLCALELVTLLVSASDATAPRRIANGDTAKNASRKGAPPAADARGGEDSVAAEIAAREAAAKEGCRTANQTTLAQVGMMDALLRLCVGQLSANSVPVRVFALRCLGDLVANHRDNQDLLFAAAVDIGANDDSGGGGAGDGRGPRGGGSSSGGGTTEPALLSALRVALRGVDAAEREAAEGVFERCLRGNTELQLMLISTIAPAGGDEDEDEDERDVSLGGLLAKALVGKSSSSGGGGGKPSATATPGGPSDLSVSCHAAAVLRHMLDGNSAAKARILSIPLELPTSSAAPPELLLPRIMRYLSAAVRASSASGGAGYPGTHSHSNSGSGGYFDAPALDDHRGAAGTKSQSEKIAEAGAVRRDGERLQAVLLRLLITWLHGCPSAVNAFLAPAAHLPMLADLARVGAGSSGSPHVAGLAAVLLGGGAATLNPNVQTLNAIP